MKIKDEKKDLLFEIGTEELPSKPLNSALTQLAVLVPELFENARLDHGTISIYATPRRIALIVEDIPLVTEEITTEYKGPALSASYEDGDPTKEPTKALIGFSKSKGVGLDAIEIRPIDGVEYTFVATTEKGRRAQEVIGDILRQILTGIEWPKTQRWGTRDERFSRPIRWLVALFGGEVIPLEFAGLTSGRSTRGHRFLAPQAVDLSMPKEYHHVLKGNKVIADPNKRRNVIIRESQDISSEFGTALLDSDVLDEVVNLTEYPTGAVGTFDEDFLRCPREILEYAMAKHQRYFAIERSDGSLDNHFIVISNGDPAYQESIVKGHERVIRARLADAVFFYDEDLKVPLDTWREKLDRVVFQEKLGSIGDKSRRMSALIDFLAKCAQVSVDEQADATRAAQLSKADLTSSAVIEFPNLQGVMGSYYALAQDESAAVATAIREHYRPRYSGDDLPSTLIGKLLSVADKMDTIAGIFVVGRAPTGTSDPFALRRSAIGILHILREDPFIDIDTLIKASLDQYLDVIDFDYDATYQAIGRFFTSRLEVILRDEGFDGDVVSAVLASCANNPADATLRCLALEQFKEHPDMIDLATAFARAKNLSDHAAGTHVDLSLFGEPEKMLHDALDRIEADEPALKDDERYRELLEGYASLRQPVDTFFDEVMVMDRDEDLKRNRLALLNRLVNVVERFADLGQLAIKK
ncbi:MAG: glycine--tRNA ligase subunit beta [Actinomycetia bacterium]|nr:glycine--tRNA ligase subunit beta [Actinomycetes bacterium]